MAILDLVPQDVIAKYPATPLTANAADFTYTASGADFASGARFPHTGRELIVVRNDNVAAQTLDINSVVDPYNRTGTITAYSIGIGEYAVFGPFPVEFWRQADGYLTMKASAADVMFAILRLPD